MARRFGPVASARSMHTSKPSCAKVVSRARSSCPTMATFAPSLRANTATPWPMVPGPSTSTRMPGWILPMPTELAEIARQRAVSMPAKVDRHAAMPLRRQARHHALEGDGEAKVAVHEQHWRPRFSGRGRDGGEGVHRAKLYLFSPTWRAVWRRGACAATLEVHRNTGSAPLARKASGRS